MRRWTPNASASRSAPALGAPRGAALARPGPKAAPEDWDAYIHQRDNPAGITREHWYHIPCGTWLTVTRDTVTHVVEATE